MNQKNVIGYFPNQWVNFSHGMQHPSPVSVLHGVLKRKQLLGIGEADERALSETASKNYRVYSRPTVHRHNLTVDVSVDVPTQGAYCTHVPVQLHFPTKIRSVPTGNTVSTCESKAANTRTFIKDTIVRYYQLLCAADFHASSQKIEQPQQIRF